MCGVEIEVVKRSNKGTERDKAHTHRERERGDAECKREQGGLMGLVQTNGGRVGGRMC